MKTAHCASAGKGAFILIVDSYVAASINTNSSFGVRPGWRAGREWSSSRVYRMNLEMCVRLESDWLWERWADLTLSFCVSWQFEISTNYYFLLLWSGYKVVVTKTIRWWVMNSGRLGSWMLIIEKEIIILLIISINNKRRRLWQDPSLEAWGEVCCWRESETPSAVASSSLVLLLLDMLFCGFCVSGFCNRALRHTVL